MNDRSRSNSVRRLRRCSAVVCLLLAALAPSAAGQAHDSLARYVPADVGLFIEGFEVDDLLLPLTEPQAWLTLAELGGQPGQMREVIEWRVRVMETIGMTPAEAIRGLFSERFAFVSPGLRQSQDAVLLCEPRRPARELLKRWNAQPLPTAGRTSLYRLPNRVGLALAHDVLIFGSAGVADGMFEEILAFEDQYPHVTSLADDPSYQQLLARVPRHPDALLFARLRAPATAPSAASALPGPLRGARNILLALHREGDLLHFSAVGDAPASAPHEDADLRQLIQRLPERTLLAYGGHVDYPALLAAADQLAEWSVLRTSLRMHERSDLLGRIVGGLRSETCVALGAVDLSMRPHPAPPVPAAALLIQTDDPEDLARDIDTLFQATISMYNLLALKVGSPVKLEPGHSKHIAAADCTVVDLTPLLARQPAADALGELQLCWTVDGDTLILASHEQWLREVLEARYGNRATLGNVVRLSSRRISRDTETIFALQPGPIADLGELWLRYLGWHAPEVLRDTWWRERQPGGRQARLGIQVTEMPERQRLVVDAVEPDSPADGILRSGDEIVGCNQRRFATTQPIREIRTGLRERRNARWIDLWVERGGITTVRRIPLPFVDPVQLLRRAVGVGQIAQRVVYHEETSGPQGSRGFLTVELRDPAAEPLFVFDLSPQRPTATAPDQVSGELNVREPQ